MNIGICYDTRSDYGIDEDDLEYTDFVSLNTVSEIKTALERCGYTAHYIGDVYKLKTLLEKNMMTDDLIFNVAEGFGTRNREALIPSLLEIYKIPHTASDTYGMALNLNKQHTKIIAQYLGIPVPRGFCFRAFSKKILAQAQAIGYPLVIKLNSEGGSMGVSLVNNEKELMRQSRSLLKKYRAEILVEEYIPGKEITVPIIGNRDVAHALGTVLILHKDGQDVSLYDNLMKSTDSDITNSLNTGLSFLVEKQICQYSVNIHQFLDLWDYSRMDFRVTPEGQPYFLEINTMPSLGRFGSFELCAQANGKTYHEMIGEIVAAAIERYS